MSKLGKKDTRIVHPEQEKYDKAMGFPLKILSLLPTIGVLKRGIIK